VVVDGLRLDRLKRRSRGKVNVEGLQIVGAVVSKMNRKERNRRDTVV
jgi:hypothetical protein